MLQLSRSSILERHLAPHGRAIHFGTGQTDFGGATFTSAAEGSTNILRLFEFPHGSNTSRLRLVLDANAFAEYTIPPDPTIDATAIIANLRSTAIDRLDDM